MEQGGACRRSAPFRCAKPRWPVTGPTGAAILPSPSRLRRAGAPTAKTRRLSGFIRPPFRLRRNRAGRSSAPPFGFAAQKRARHFAARNHPVRLSASRPWLRHPAPLFCRSRHGCATPGPQRQNPGACRRSAPFRLRETARPDVSPAGGNVLATPFSLCSNVAPHIPAGSAGVRSFVPRLAPRSHPGAQLRSAPFRCAKPRWPVVAPAGGNVLAAPFSLCSNAAPRSHPGAQLRFILKQLYASGCPFLRNFPFFSSVPHPFFASAPGRTDTQKSAAGIPRRGFNTFSVSWLYFPLPNT